MKSDLVGVFSGLVPTACQCSVACPDEDVHDPASIMFDTLNIRVTATNASGLRPGEAEYLNFIVGADLYTCALLSMFGIILCMMLMLTNSTYNENTDSTELSNLLVAMRFREEIHRYTMEKQTLRRAKRACILLTNRDKFRAALLQKSMRGSSGSMTKARHFERDNLGSLANSTTCSIASSPDDRKHSRSSIILKAMGRLKRVCPRSANGSLPAIVITDEACNNTTNPKIPTPNPHHHHHHHRHHHRKKHTVIKNMDVESDDDVL